MPTAKPVDAEQRIAGVVREVLRCPANGEGVLAQALSVGYSRAHWTRMFARLVGETPAHFVRRIRMEKARVLLAEGGLTAREVALAVGYDDPSAFARAFRREVRISPLAYRAAPVPVDPRGPGIHWVRLWDEISAEEVSHLNRRFPLRFTPRSAVRLAAILKIGSYAFVGDYLDELSASMRDRGVEPSARRFFTVYYDSIWTHPSCDGMRADVGYRLAEGEPPPTGFREVFLPRGSYATFDADVPRTERNAAWSWMSRNSFGGLAFDEYEGYPLPWDQARTRLWVQLR